MKLVHLLFTSLLLLTIMSCQNKFKFKEGDFLFQDLDCGPMCDAIEEVTQGINGAKLSHVGLVVLENDTLKVLEAISAGVILSPFNDFIHRSHDANRNPKILVGRFKKEYQEIIPQAIEQLNIYIGAAYNHSFIMGNESYYCSQLLYLIFQQAHEGEEVFELAPMTFKPLENDQFFPVWEEYGSVQHSG